MQVLLSFLQSLLHQIIYVSLLSLPDPTLPFIYTNSICRSFPVSIWHQMIYISLLSLQPLHAIPFIETLYAGHFMFPLVPLIPNNMSHYYPSQTPLCHPYIQIHYAGHFIFPSGTKKYTFPYYPSQPLLSHPIIETSADHFIFPSCSK